MGWGVRRGGGTEAVRAGSGGRGGKGGDGGGGGGRASLTSNADVDGAAGVWAACGAWAAWVSRLGQGRRHTLWNDSRWAGRQPSGRQKKLNEYILFRQWHSATGNAYKYCIVWISLLISVTHFTNMMGHFLQLDFGQHPARRPRSRHKLAPAWPPRVSGIGAPPRRRPPLPCPPLSPRPPEPPVVHGSQKHGNYLFLDKYSIY